MERYFIELTKSNGKTVVVLERFEDSAEAGAVAIFEQLIKEAREEKTGDGARITYGWHYDYAAIVEVWSKW